MSHPRKTTVTIVTILLAITSCAPIPAPDQTPAVGTASTSTASSGSAPGAQKPASTLGPAKPQPTSAPVSLGPDAADFPSNYSPLTGQPINDLSTLGLPALLISISNFPVDARPQAGLSFASYVFEFSITEGATRFLSVFYGDFPYPELPLRGGCEVRAGSFKQTGEFVLGGRLWLDQNADGTQEQGEPGIGGVCMSLLDANDKPIDQTTTDSNGYYGFNVPVGNYTVEAAQPAGKQFTKANLGDESHDSDADPLTGRMLAQVRLSLLSMDAGLVPSPGITPTPDPAVKMPEAAVGPVRSGRLVYADLAAMFQDSCLVYAFASEEVISEIPHCAMVAHDFENGGRMLPLERMRAIAEDNRKADTVFNYASNRYTDVPPAGGAPGTQLDVYFALLNQSGWTYNPLMQSYLLYTDNASKETAGQLHADTDRLNGRALHFENVIVLFTEHTVVLPTLLDMDLEQGSQGPAYLFRDGKAYSIHWSTRSGEYEKKTGLRRPIQWLNKDGSPVPLKPGHTWVLVVTPFSTLTDAGSGEWKLRFYAPEGAN